MVPPDGPGRADARPRLLSTGHSLIGIVHYIFHRSTWTVGNYCYLQDLFTAEAARGRGAGRKLIEAVYERAGRGGASRVWWLTHETNASARILYDQVADLPGFIQYRKVL
jgi:GNAT superfamily N-acetyltransferase